MIYFILFILIIGIIKSYLWAYKLKPSDIIIPRLNQIDHKRNEKENNLY